MASIQVPLRREAASVVVVCRPSPERGRRVQARGMGGNLLPFSPADRAYLVPMFYTGSDAVEVEGVRAFCSKYRLPSSLLYLGQADRASLLECEKDAGKKCQVQYLEERSELILSD